MGLWKDNESKALRRSQALEMNCGSWGSWIGQGNSERVRVDRMP